MHKEQFETQAYQIHNFKNTLRQPLTPPHLTFKPKKVNGVKVLLPFERKRIRKSNKLVDTSDLWAFHRRQQATIPNFEPDHRFGDMRKNSARIHKKTRRREGIRNLLAPDFIAQTQNLRFFTREVKTDIGKSEELSQDMEDRDYWGSNNSNPPGPNKDLDKILSKNELAVKNNLFNSNEKVS